jgi:hypothetical protein
VHLWPSTHQSHGNEDETHCVQELYVLQSKKVKFVATKSGPDVILTDNLAVKWCCPGGMEGKRSVLGVVQLTPDPFLVALVINGLSRTVNAHKKCPVKLGRLSIMRSNVLAVVLCS